MTLPLSRRCVAELVGTYFLVLIGCGVVVVGGMNEALTHEGIAIVWGLIVMVLIYAIGDLSGCHINPAVTIAFAAAGRFPKAEVLPYVVAQSAGAIIAASSLRMVFGVDETNLGSTSISEPLTLAGGFAVEWMMTLLLMFVVMGVSTGAKEKSITAGLAVGSTIAMEAMTAGPLTGASMNPARSLGPALLSGNTSQLGLYFGATVIGSVTGMLLYKLIRPEAKDEEQTATKK